MEVVAALKDGAVFVLPTDTVYGLVCDAKNKKSVEKIFKIKKRDKKIPLPVFVGDIEMAKEYAEIGEEQENILQKKWPGATTFIFKIQNPESRIQIKSKILNSKLLTKNGTIALRMPDHGLIRQILSELGNPLAQTSANISGKPATTDIKEVVRQLGGEDLIIIDAGYLPESSPSTIIDLTENKSKILRK